MYIKLIHVTTTKDRKDDFLRCQRDWNVAMASCAGFIDSLVASDDSDANRVVIITVWRDKSSLEEFMAGDHDLVEEQTGIREFYDHLNIDFLNVESSLHPSAAGHVLFGSGAAGLIELSESYRASAILRAGIVSGLFDQVGETRAELVHLSQLLGITMSNIKRLCFSLSSMGLIIFINDAVVQLSAYAQKYLLKGKDAYLGHLVLHNTRPHLWKRWGALSEELGIKNATASTDDHEQFLYAMHDVAMAGQAKDLLELVDLKGRHNLLDIGGALGDYSSEMLKVYPELRADVLDLPQSRSSAQTHINAIGLDERLRFIEGDYRESLPDNDYDVMLLANVLRGEKRLDAESLLKKMFSGLMPGGLVLIYDLFCDTPAGHSGLLSGFFGLHLPEAMNPSTSELCKMLHEAGFIDVSVIPLDDSIVANMLVVAYVP